MMQPLVTTLDDSRLRSLLDSQIGKTNRTARLRLSKKLDQARLVPASGIPATVVTMNTKVTCWRLATGQERDLTLVYPWASDPNTGRLSILSNEGIDLLGALPGHAVWLDGEEWRVVLLTYQPEANGNYFL